jgi:hypothetical protein
MIRAEMIPHWKCQEYGEENNQDSGKAPVSSEANSLSTTAVGVDCMLYSSQGQLWCFQPINRLVWLQTIHLPVTPSAQQHFGQSTIHQFSHQYTILPKQPNIISASSCPGRDPDSIQLPTPMKKKWKEPHMTQSPRILERNSICSEPERGAKGGDTMTMDKIDVSRKEASERAYTGGKEPKKSTEWSWDPTSRGQRTINRTSWEAGKVMVRTGMSKSEQVFERKNKRKLIP